VGRDRQAPGRRQDLQVDSGPRPERARRLDERPTRADVYQCDGAPWPDGRADLDVRRQSESRVNATIHYF
jgi:hypothetical protein